MTMATYNVGGIFLRHLSGVATRRGEGGHMMAATDRRSMSRGIKGAQRSPAACLVHRILWYGLNYYQYGDVAGWRRRVVAA